MVDETAFIGDVHGEASALKELLDLVGRRVQRIVFLGDLVNRGPSSKQVLDTITALCADNHFEIVVLAGNHDQTFFEVLTDPSREDEFLRMGGAATIRSYVRPPYKDVFTQLRTAIPVSHKKLLGSLAIDWRSENLIACHRFNDTQDHSGSGFVVAGHSVQRNREPYVDDHCALIDTGCGTVRNGRLTAFYWPSKTWDQVETSRA